VLKDQPTPSVSARLHKQPAFRKPAKFDRGETEIFRKRTNLICGTVIVARQENDALAPMFGRILVKDGSKQMVEALNQSSASKGLRDECELNWKQEPFVQSDPDNSRFLFPPALELRFIPTTAKQAAIFLERPINRCMHINRRSHKAKLIICFSDRFKSLLLACEGFRALIRRVRPRVR
jgi:hypothetical protein